MQFLVILGVVLVGSVLVISFFGFVAVPPIPFDYVLRSH
jgi:hypothetical protein